MALELKSLGVNLTFSPVADIASNPENDVIGPRAFGHTSQEVIDAVVPFARLLGENGVAAWRNTFPGTATRKWTRTSSCRVLTSTSISYRERAAPFPALVDDGIRMVMTAHVFYPRLDPDAIATISERILKGILREELGFQGVVVSDALGMGAILNEFDKRSTVVGALKADLDIFLVAGDGVDVNMAIRLAEHMREALGRKEIDEENFTRSFRRISAFLDDLPQYDVQLLDSDTFGATTNSRNHSEWASKAERAAKSCAKPGTLPGFCAGFEACDFLADNSKSMIELRLADDERGHEQQG